MNKNDILEININHNLEVNMYVQKMYNLINIDNNSLWTDKIKSLNSCLIKLLYYLNKKDGLFIDSKVIGKYLYLEKIIELYKKIDVSLPISKELGLYLSYDSIKHRRLGR